MEELSKIAEYHYQAASPEVQKSAKDFFKSMDTDGDGLVDLQDFLSFMKEEGMGYPEMHNPHFFKKLDRHGKGKLGFWEVMTLYYIIISGRPFCRSCGHFIPGIFFSCVKCLNDRNSSFTICHRCYRSKECRHNHDGRMTQFLDTYTLLQVKLNSVPRSSADKLRVAPQVTDRTQSKAIVLASNTMSRTTSTRRSSQASSSREIVPATRKMSAALKALEVALAISKISSTMCTIL